MEGLLRCFKLIKCTLKDIQRCQIHRHCWGRHYATKGEANTKEETFPLHFLRCDSNLICVFDDHRRHFRLDKSAIMDRNSAYSYYTYIKFIRRTGWIKRALNDFSSSNYKQVKAKLDRPKIRTFRKVGSRWNNLGKYWNIYYSTII